jgi:hypothetical protein
MPTIKALGADFKKKWGADSKNYVVIVFKTSKREYTYATRKKLEGITD